MENLNLVELLRDCPTGMELDSTVFDNITFDYVNTQQNRVYCKVGKSESVWFTPKGGVNLLPDAKCIIFPKGKTTWEGFQRPFKDGDIITDVRDSNPFIFRYDNGEFYDVHCALINDFLQIYKRKNNWVSNRREFRYATEEEKQKLFDAIKANGYKWNAETKTLEELPKFKVGDKIEKCGYRFTIKEVREYHYLTKCGNKIPIDNQDDFSLVPNKFDITTLKVFESRVLVRSTNNNLWKPALFGFVNSGAFYVLGGNAYRQCIPYEANKELLNTTNDCDDFYKTWEK